MSMKKIKREGATKPIHDLLPRTSVRVWVDVDKKIADSVKWLNRLKGVRTFTSCQGTIGEGGANPYSPYVMAYVPPLWEKEVAKHFTFGEKGEGWVYLHPIGKGINWYELAQQRKQELL